jgi:hypothetical protein
MNAAVVLFLGVLAIVLLCAARLALWLIFTTADTRVDQLVDDALADANARRADDWSRDERWRR